MQLFNYTNLDIHQVLFISRKKIGESFAPNTKYHLAINHRNKSYNHFAFATSISSSDGAPVNNLHHLSEYHYNYPFPTSKS